MYTVYKSKTSFFTNKLCLSWFKFPINLNFCVEVEEGMVIILLFLIYTIKIVFSLRNSWWKRVIFKNYVGSASCNSVNVRKYSCGFRDITKSFWLKNIFFTIKGITGRCSLFYIIFIDVWRNIFNFFMLKMFIMTKLNFKIPCGSVRQNPWVDFFVPW